MQKKLTWGLPTLTQQIFDELPHFLQNQPLHLLYRYLKETKPSQASERPERTRYAKIMSSNMNEILAYLLPTLTQQISNSISQPFHVTSTSTYSTDSYQQMSHILNFGSQVDPYMSNFYGNAKIQILAWGLPILNQRLHIFIFPNFEASPATIPRSYSPKDRPHLDFFQPVGTQIPKKCSISTHPG